MTDPKIDALWIRFFEQNIVAEGRVRTPLGVFTLRTRKARMAPSISTGKVEKFPANKYVHFRASKGLRSLVNKKRK